MKYDFNLLQTAAQRFMENGEFGKAIRIYLMMADGDPSLDGGYLGERLGQCYEGLGDISAARYWYGRAVEENPEVRALSKERKKALGSSDVSDIVPGYIIQ